MSGCGGSTRLSERQVQVQVLRLVADGLTDAEIALALHIAVSTARTHLAWACESIDARNRTHAAVLAVRQNLI